MAWRKRAIWRCDKGGNPFVIIRKSRGLNTRPRLLFVPWYGGYERVSILAWHLGQVTRILPLPLGTESIWPQLGHLR